ncbi:MAG: hypothetical protein KGN79_13695 [Acidobacteriota bacterium]|nr:hypothetical protein [Acidobacteriota bacterium]
MARWACRMCGMRLQVSINNEVPVRASLQAQGWLSAQLNLSSHDNDGGRLSVRAIDSSDEPNSTHSIWELGTLSIGDSVQIQILNDGEADPPTAVRRTSDSPKNLFTSVDLARELLTAISICDKELSRVLESSRSTEPKDEFQKIAEAMSSIIVDLDLRLIQPTLRRHPELIAEAREMKLI